MTTSTEELDVERPWTRAMTVGLVALVLVMLAALPFLVSSVYEASDDTNDASIYIVTARSILAGEGYSYLGEPFIVRPPGFALLVAGVIGLFGESFTALHALVGLFGVLACAALYALAAPRVGAALAFLVALAAFVHPDFRRLSNQVMSDVPGLAFVLVGLLVERWASARRSVARDAVLGLVIVAGAYVRSVALLLVPAILLSRWFARGDVDRRWSSFLRSRALVLLVTVVAGMAPWSVRCALHHPTPPVDQTHLYSYGTAMWRERAYDPGSPRLALREILARAGPRAESIAGSILDLDRAALRLPESAALARERPFVHWGKLLFGGFCIAVVFWSANQRRRASDFFTVAVVLVLTFYFAFRLRLALPIKVLTLVTLAEGLSTPIERGWPKLHRLVVFALAASLAGFGTLTLLLVERATRVIGVRHAQYETAARTLQPALDDAPVASAVGWHWSVYLERPVVTLALAGKRDGAAGIAAVLEKRRVDTVILADFLEEDRALVPLFRRIWGEPARVGETSVFRRPR